MIDFPYEDERSDLKSFLEYTKGELEALDRGSHTYEVIRERLYESQRPAGLLWKVRD